MRGNYIWEDMAGVKGQPDRAKVAVSLTAKVKHPATSESEPIRSPRNMSSTTTVLQKSAKDSGLYF